MPISRRRLAFATEGFLASMRRSYFARHPDRTESSVPASLDNVSLEDRGILVSAVEAALARLGKSSDEAFEKWSDERLQETP